MTLSERIESMEEIFDDLQSCNSRLYKMSVIEEIPNELKDDFNFCLEVLSGKHKLGYKYEYVEGSELPPIQYLSTIQSIVEWLKKPLEEHDLSNSNIYKYLSSTFIWADFLEPLCNRTYKLGIGSSILEKSSTSPMLAKKFEGILPYNYCSWAITEKLDGNRCISYFDGEEWQFVSRNGKRMNVEFDMSGLPEELVYDGEVISPDQDELSNDIYNYCTRDIKSEHRTINFNKTSGLINTHNKHKSLVYKIFDVQDNAPYELRRKLLNSLKPSADNVKVLPLIYIVHSTEEFLIREYLEKVTDLGGEGLMLNAMNAPYQGKRTKDLLKFKKVQTMDMRVVGITEGTGKYEGQVGAIECECWNMGMKCSCSVGSGLNDSQRLEWKLHPERIIDKIVEVSYFDISQNKNTKLTGNFSLRFPRLKRVREDKNEESEF